MDNYHTSQDEWHRLLCVLPIYLFVSNSVCAANSITIVIDGGKIHFENLTLVNDISGAFIIQAKTAWNLTAASFFSPVAERAAAGCG
ncbi:hypothetical protein [Pantoea ananatis]|uniref:hypothetical protein n=1 Tax=Pantoea ananas TaxID=553 RepID=UPI0023505EFA|nr:hypothetical protein [Pantoea ananatis]MDC7860797.1 hypothetical protein [Pantoea ananatis]